MNCNPLGGGGGTISTPNKHLELSHQHSLTPKHHTYAYPRGSNTMHTNICQRRIEQNTYTATPFGGEAQTTTTPNPTTRTLTPSHPNTKEPHICIPKGHQHQANKHLSKGNSKQQIYRNPLWEEHEMFTLTHNSSTKNNFHTNTF